MTAVERERNTNGVVHPANYSPITTRMSNAWQLQIRSNLRNNVAGQNAIVAQYKKELEAIKTPSGLSIFEMHLIRYPVSGGIDIGATLHSKTVYKIKRLLP